MVENEVIGFVANKIMGNTKFHLTWRGNQVPNDIMGTFSVSFEVRGDLVAANKIERKYCKQCGTGFGHS